MQFGNFRATLQNNAPFSAIVYDKVNKKFNLLMHENAPITFVDPYPIVDTPRFLSLLWLNRALLYAKEIVDYVNVTYPKTGNFLNLDWKIKEDEVIPTIIFFDPNRQQSYEIVAVDFLLQYIGTQGRNALHRSLTDHFGAQQPLF